MEEGVLKLSQFHNQIDKKVCEPELEVCVHLFTRKGTIKLCVFLKLVPQKLSKLAF